MNDTSSNANKSNLAAVIVVALAVVVLALGGFYIWTNRPQPAAVVAAPAVIDLNVPVNTAPEPKPEVTEPAAVEQTPPPASKPLRPIVPPPATLEAGDAQVKLALADLAPAMAQWVIVDQQLRKWVLAIDLMADGNVPKSYRPLSYPIEHFEPAAQGAEPNVQYVMKPETFTRADMLVKAFTAIDPALIAQYYQAWLPILDKAYQEQGKKDKFDQRFRAALQHVIDAKPLTTTPILAKRGGVIYVYADEKLEAASDVEKMMWRLGADNSLKIQNYLKQILVNLPK